MPRLADQLSLLVVGAWSAALRGQYMQGAEVETQTDTRPGCSVSPQVRHFFLPFFLAPRTPVPSQSVQVASCR